MANKIVDPRDQQFIMYEMLGVDKLCDYDKFKDFSRDMFDMILTEAENNAALSRLSIRPGRQE